MATSVGALLEDVNERLAAVGVSVPGMQNPLAEYLLGGKRLRAHLLIGIALHGADPRPADVARYAAFVELIHAGGLCHDDIVDRSLTRRGLPSLHHVVGERMASLGGLYLMSRAFTQIAGDVPRVKQWVADAAQRVARGQAREMTDLYRLDVPVSEYLARTADKTAALFSLAARLGTFAGGYDDARCDPIVAFGRQIGMAFQLGDDLRDICGCPALGREAGTDLREGVYTLPVLFAVAERRPGHVELARRLRELRTGRDQATVQACRRLMIESGAMGKAAAVLRAYVVGAHRCAAKCFAPVGKWLADYATSIGDGLGPEMSLP